MALPPEVPQEVIDRLYPRVPVPWLLGEPIEVGDTKQLHEFEGTLPKYIDDTPNTDHDWQARPTLDELLRPKKPQLFLGKIADIILVPLANPSAVLTQSEQRGLRGINGSSATARYMQGDRSNINERRAIGFDLFARAQSSGGKQVSTIETSLFYLPKSLVHTSPGHYAKNPSSTAYGLRRYFLTPVTNNPDAFDELVRASAERSRQVRRDNLGKVILAGFSQ